MLDDDGFVAGMGSFADGAEAVESRDSQCGSEVAVGGSAGRGFVEREAEIGCKFTGSLEETHRSAEALHWRAIDAASDGEGAALVGWLEREEFLFDAGAVGFARDADVDFGPGLSGNYVGFGSAAGYANADCEAALEVGPTADGFDDVRQLADGADTFFEIDAGVGGASGDLDSPIASAFAGGLAGESLRGFHDEDRAAFACELLGDGARDGAADLFVAVEEEDDFFVEQLRFGEHFKRGEGHGYAGFHVERAGAPETAVGDFAGHGLECSEGPYGVEMAEKKNAVCGGGAGFGTEAGFEDVAELTLPVELYAAAEGFGVGSD